MKSIEAIDIMLDYYENHYGDNDWIDNKLSSFLNKCSFCKFSNDFRYCNNYDRCSFCLWIKYMKMRCFVYAMGKFKFTANDLKYGKQEIPTNIKKLWRKLRIKQLREWRKKELAEINAKK